MLARLLLCAVVLASACGPDEAASEPTEADTEPDTGQDSYDGGGEWGLVYSAEIDLLFVIDDSATMAGAQARLVAGIGALVDELAQHDLRVGITTADGGNPACAATPSTPGRLVRSSCLDRVDAGAFVGPDGDRSSACTDLCSLRDADLTPMPTGTELDATRVPRDWIEQDNLALNVAGFADLTQALQCYLPQGIGGCDFVSPLEGMYRALADTEDETSPNHGFLRATSVLAVVIVTDGSDCSHDPAWDLIFTDDKVFWADPDADAPTRAVCWNAGVACTGPGPTYAECHAEDFDAAGEPGADPADAVLHPIRRYVDSLRAIQTEKQRYDPHAEVVVAAIAGVPPGYAELERELVYADAADPAFQAEHGIGPGCADAATITGLPPVRVAAWAGAFADADRRNVHSICEEDYSASLATIAAAIRAQIPPVCYPSCARDTIPATEILDPGCELHMEDLIAGTAEPIAPCLEALGAWTPPPGETICVGLRFDADGSATPSGLDDMSAGCTELGFNVEFDVVRTAPLPAGVTLSALCEQSSDKRTDCPRL